MASRLEQAGVRYSRAGRTNDAIRLMSDAGATCFRLRLFVNPNGRHGVVNTLDYTLALAERIKRSGASLLLDFHYSDTWADPGKQHMPAAWTNLTFDGLEKEVERYTADTVAAFRRRGCQPDIVQVGNEIDPGFLWPAGRLTGKEEDWNRFARLLKAGIRGVRDGADPKHPPRIMIHITSGGGPEHAVRWLGELESRGVGFDLIGLSYYPWWHGSLDRLKETLARTAERFHRDIVVVETAYPWRDVRPSPDWNTAAMTWPQTPEGQASFVADLRKAVREVPEGLGGGILWWFPESVPAKTEGIWFGGSMALFDPAGRAQPALEKLLSR